MVAVALIAISFVTLIGAQSQSVAIATASKFDIMAALLARQKLTELCLHDYDELNDAAGDFGEEHPEFVWKTEIQELPESGTGIKGSGNMLKSIDLTVSARQDAALSLEVRTLVFKKIAVVK
jgi:general secretion pathway protein I